MYVKGVRVWNILKLLLMRLYIGLGTNPKEVEAPLDEESPALVWEKFTELARAWADPGKGYTARRAMEEMRTGSDYDQLARFGEWDDTDAALLTPLVMQGGET